MGTTIGRSEGQPPTGGEVQLGKYVLEAPLGVGGMAEVFKARTVGAEGFKRSVAIKRVLPDASKNPAFSEMFIAEAMLSSRMQHANIVAVLDFARDHEDRLYLVMELVEGRDLNAIIDSGRLPYPMVIYIVTEVLRGLGYAHDLPAGPDGVRGLVHRDVSPHNVLCSWSGAVKVSDFGIAKARDATAATASAVIKGKPAYMSPEQINGAPLDGRSDLFAVGVMLWQMLTGEHLFAAGSMTETFARVLFGTVARPTTLVPEVPPDLEEVVMRLLAREPGLRYATAEDAIEDLLRCQHAPRNGGRSLEELLIERFPERAPMRTGQRSRSPQAALAQGTPPDVVPPPGWSPGGTVPTVPGRVAVPQAAAPMPGASSRRGAVLVGAAIVGVVLLAVVIALLAGGGPSSSSGLATDGGDRPAEPDAAVRAVEAAMIDAGLIDAESIDASPIDAPAPSIPIDASPQPDARRRPTRDGEPGSGSGSGSGTGSSAIQEIKIPG